MILASARTEIADYLSTLISVYIIVIIMQIVVQILFAAGVRMPYSRASSALLSFLRDVVEPFLRLFRRLIPPFGGLDLSPMLAIFSLYLINEVVVAQIIHG
jgi:YggT family protein